MKRTEVVEVIAGVLTPYIGESMARAAITAQLQKLRLPDEDADVIQGADLDALLARLASGLNVFVGAQTSQAALKAARRALGRKEPTP